MTGLRTKLPFTAVSSWGPRERHLCYPKAEFESRFFSIVEFANEDPQFAGPFLQSISPIKIHHFEAGLTLNKLLHGYRQALQISFKPVRNCKSFWTGV